MLKQIKPDNAVSPNRLLISWSERENITNIAF